MLIPLSMVVGVSVSNGNMSARMADFYAVTIVDHVERGRTSLSSCWMCYCTLINQFITLEQRKSLRNLQTTNHTLQCSLFVFNQILLLIIRPNTYRLFQPNVLGTEYLADPWNFYWLYRCVTSSSLCASVVRI